MRTQRRPSQNFPRKLYYSMIHRPDPVRFLPLLDQLSYLNPKVKTVFLPLFICSKPLDYFHFILLAGNHAILCTPIFKYHELYNVWLLSKICVCIVGKHMCHGMHVQVREQLAGISSLSLPCEFQGLSYGHPAW